MSKNFFVIFSRLLINIFVVFFSSRLLLLNLGEDNYGLFNVITSFIVSLSIFNTILVTSTNRFIAIEVGKVTPQVSQIFNTLLSLHLIIGLIILILGLIFGYFWINYYLNIDEGSFKVSKFIFVLSLFVAFVNVVTTPFIAYQTANSDFKHQSNVMLLQSILLLLVAYLIKYASNKLVLYSIFSTVVYILISLSHILYVKFRYNSISFKFGVNKMVLKEILNYSGWMSIGAFAYMLKYQGNAIIINMFFGTRINASYGISNQVFQQINGIVNNMNTIFLPKIMNNEGSGDRNNQTYIGALSSRYLFYLGLLISLPLFINLDYLLNLWLVKVPEFTSIFIKLFLIDMLLLLVNNGIANLVFARGNVRNYQLTINTVNLLNLPLTFVLFKLGYEPYYLIFSSILFTIVSNIFRIYFAEKLLKITFKKLYEEVYKYIIVVTMICVILYYTPIFFGLNGMLYLLGYTAVSCSLLLICIYAFGLPKYEQQIINNLIKKQYEKFKTLFLKS